MDKRVKKIKQNQLSKNQTDSDGSVNVQLENTSKELTKDDINYVLNVGDRFDKERQNATHYRLMGTINPLVSNPLFNISGPDSWSSFFKSKFRDESVPPNGTENLTFKQSIDKNLIEENGWFGYEDPEFDSPTTCSLIHMKPYKKDFDFNPKQGEDDNWSLTVTYPYRNEGGYVVNGGIKILGSRNVEVGGVGMVAFSVPVWHNLRNRDTVKITGLLPSSLNGTYTVRRRGLDNGDFKQYYFCVEMDTSISISTANARFKRVSSGFESDYYYRIFKKVPTEYNSIIKNDNYELFSPSFTKNIYNDLVTQFSFNDDIDVGGITDNLGRPISELYLTILKNKKGEFTPIKSGIETPFVDGVVNDTDTPVISRIHNGGSSPIQSHSYVEYDPTIDDDEFYGDIVEYNKSDVEEVILSSIAHRFNTKNRENNPTVGSGSGEYTLGPRHEGYYYFPHYQITIRRFSTYIEQGDDSVAGIPSYAQDLGDGRYLWRDLLDIGFNDARETNLDYPFLNGSHYIYQNYCFELKRQDPFNIHGLYYGSFPRDPFGIRRTGRFDVNRSEDVC